jgi:putative membrane protein
VTIAYNKWGAHSIIVDSLPASILGVALAILIGFRINNAYERWWEARRLWGAIVNDSRSIVRQSASFFVADDINGITLNEAAYEKQQFAYRQIAFVYALKNHLRRQQNMEELQPFLPEAEFGALAKEQNIPNTILLFHADHIEQLREKGMIDNFRHMQMDTKLSALCDSMGGCERIKNTVFPRQYSVYTTSFIAIYSYLLPFILVQKSGWVTIPFTLLIGFIFFALDSVARGIENPFENRFNDTPMSSICRTIEINIKQMLKLDDLPEPVQPVNGFLF